MKTSQKLIYACCLLVAILDIFCSGQTWRPQGRFGKRTRLEPELPYYGLTQIHDIPVEDLFPVKELKRVKSKPRFCTLTGLNGYPPCDFPSTSSEDDSINIFDL